MALFEGYRVLWEELADYWRAYGGWRAIAKSPAVMASALLSAASYPAWEGAKWADLSVSIIPNLLGFTLGAMALVLAFPSSKFFAIFSEEGAEDSYYIDLASKFVHFIVVQILALLLALLAKSWCNPILSYMGTFFLFYAVICAVLTALALFGVAQLSNKAAALPEKASNRGKAEAEGIASNTSPDRPERDGQ